MFALFKSITAALRTIGTASGLEAFPAGGANQFAAEYERQTGYQQANHDENSCRTVEGIENVDRQECRATDQRPDEQPDRKPLPASVAFRIRLENIHVVATMLGPALSWER